MTDNGLKNRIIEIIETSLARWNVPSAGYGIIKDGEVFLTGGYGLRDVEKGLPADSDTVYMIGSCTKAFTATIVAKLVDEGKLDWDTPVREYLPELRFYDDYTTEHVTLRDLLCHRLGMPRHEWSWNRVAFSRQELLHNLRYLEPNAPFRTVCQYFNQGYLVTGCVIERVTGKTYEECVEEYLFRPLGMTRSSVTKDALEFDPNGAKPYGNAEEFNTTGTMKRIPIYRPEAELRGDTKTDPMAPIGMINSNADDMLKWVQFHLDMGRIGGEQYISAGNMHEMHYPQIHYKRAYSAKRNPALADADVALSPSYAMAWKCDVYRGHTHIHHGGNLDGYSAFTSLVPDMNLGIVLYTNRDMFMGREAIEHQIIDAFLGVDDIDWNERYWVAMEKELQRMVAQGKTGHLGERKSGTSPSHALQDYVGVYGRRGYEDIEIRLEGERLVLHFSYDTFPLTHYHYDAFMLRSSHIDMMGDIPVVFANALTGDVESVSIMLNFEPGTELVRFRKK